MGHRKLVVCLDGPLAGRWYFAEGPGSFALMREAALATAEPRAAAGHPPADVLGYTPTRKLVDHPSEPAVGTALRFTADDRAQPLRRLLRD